MRKYGQIDGVNFVRVGFSMKALATKYKLFLTDASGDAYNQKPVYADTMLELKEQINKYNQVTHEEN